MPWTPTETLLGTVVENENFSYSIQYYTEETGPSTPDPVTGEPVPGATTQTYYQVRVVPQTVKPTVTITNGDPATISGYFQKVFNDVIQYRNYEGSIVTLTGDALTGAWDKLNTNDAFEMTSFRPDTSRDMTLTYNASAYNGETVVASQAFTVRIFDPSWTAGQTNLKNAVAITVAKD